MTFPQSVHFIVSQLARFLSPIGLAAEWILVVAAAVLVLRLPVSWARPLGAVRRLFRSAVARPGRAIGVCIVLPVLARILLLPISPVPAPSIHDEFSHLLLADTLARGRLTNPTPVMWR